MRKGSGLFVLKRRYKKVLDFLKKILYSKSMFGARTIKSRKTVRTDIPLFKKNEYFSKKIKKDVDRAFVKAYVAPHRLKKNIGCC